MSRKTLVILALIVAGGLLVYLLQPQNGDPAAERLAKRAARQKNLAQSAARVDLAELTRKGLGQPLPGYLRTRLDSSGGFWFVGKPGSEMGVEIPFEPGRVPHPPSSAEPVHENPGFLGAEACRECHTEKYESFVHTAHYRTCRLAIPGKVNGVFEPGNNTMKTSDPDVFFKMIERDDHYYQRVSFFDWQFEVPIHLVIGSAKMAESYLYWHDDELFQMNCTWLVEDDRWINSPGYLDGDAAYARPIPSGCLECHVTYVDFRKSVNHYTPSTLIPGVSCERCHGPGQEHVAYHQAHPEENEARDISVPSDLTRQQQLDLCGQCHSADKLLKDERGFQFRPGDLLSEHYVRDDSVDTTANSVHTNNQVARLAKSECFQQSEMACAECHNPHQQERGNMPLFSQRCLNCHQTDHCGMEPQLGAKLAQNCIDCHMPLRATDQLRVDTAEGNLFPPLRDHYIRVDQAATDQFLDHQDTTTPSP